MLKFILICKCCSPITYTCITVVAAATIHFCLLWPECCLYWTAIKGSLVVRHFCMFGSCAQFCISLMLLSWLLVAYSFCWNLTNFCQLEPIFIYFIICVHTFDGDLVCSLFIISFAWSFCILLLVMQPHLHVIWEYVYGSSAEWVIFLFHSVCSCCIWECVSVAWSAKLNEFVFSSLCFISLLCNFCFVVWVSVCLVVALSVKEYL